MGFDIFSYRSENEELKDMFSKLTDDNYAITSLPYDSVMKYTVNLKYAVKLRRLSNGKVKVKRLVDSASLPSEHKTFQRTSTPTPITPTEQE